MAIALPRAGGGSVGTGGGRGRARLPDAGDVPRIAPARDPGVQVPRTAQFAGAEARARAGSLDALSGGLDDFGTGVSSFGRSVAREEARQQVRHDATRTSETLLAFERFSGEESRRSQAEDDLAAPDYLDKFQKPLAKERDRLLGELDGVSAEAKDDLTLRLQSSLEGTLDAAGLRAIEAARQRAADVADATINQLSTLAERDPDFLAQFLREARSRLSLFDAALTGNQERDIARKARQEIVRAAVAGLVRSGRFLDARLLLDSDEFDIDLTREMRSSAVAMIESGERQAVTDAERVEQEGERMVAAAQEVRAAQITDGIFEGTTNDADLDAALENREIDGRQFISARKLLAAQSKPSALEDDPYVVENFTRRLDLGTLTSNAVIDAFADKQITQATMNRFRGDIDGGPDDFQTNEQRKMLRDNVGGTSGLGAILGEDKTVMVNDAVQEYNERTRGLNREDPLVVRRDIESRAAEPREVDSFFRPRYMVGPDKETMNVEATMKATLKAFRAGEITPAQLLRETQTINDIAAARARQ